MKNHKFSVIKKDKLFYDRFEYCIGFYLDEVSCLRVLDHDYIDDIIARRQQWREICQQRWAKSKISHPTILTRDWKEITDQVKEDLHSLATVLLATQISYKLVVSVNQAYVYSNDLTLINHD